MQIINWSKQHDPTLTINYAIKLATRRLPQTSGYLYPRVAVIRIDVHPVGENLTNTSYAFHAQSMYGPWPYVSHAVHI
jgi:hypothetical protein